MMSSFLMKQNDALDIFMIDDLILDSWSHIRVDLLQLQWSLFVTNVSDDNGPVAI